MRTTFTRNFLYLQRWSQAELDRRGVNFHVYLSELEKPLTKPDAVAVTMLAAYIGKTLMLVSCDGYWSSDQSDPTVVLSYLGQGLYTRTKVGKFYFLTITTFLKFTAFLIKCRNILFHSPFPYVTTKDSTTQLNIAANHTCFLQCNFRSW